MKRLFNEINPTVPGFTTPRVIAFLFECVLLARAKNCVEIGSFMGRSATGICMAMQTLGDNGNITCVDLFEQPVTKEYLTYPVIKQIFEYAGDSRHYYNDLTKISNIENCFDATVERFPFMHGRVKKIKADSKTVKFKKGEVFDFAYIDGDHSYEGVSNDFRRIVPHIRRGHIAVFDDCSDQFPGVQQFMAELISTPGVKTIGKEYPDVAVCITDYQSVKRVWG